MTEFETTEDGWARGVFDRARTRAGTEPHWLPDPAAASRLSARHRFRVRATGALTATAILGISATAYATLGGGTTNGGNAVGPASATTTTSPGTDAAAGTLTKYLSLSTAGQPDPKASKPATRLPGVPASAVPVLQSIVSSLDPGLGHLRYGTGPRPDQVDTDTTGWVVFKVQGDSWWSPQGAAFAFDHTGGNLPLGHVHIQLTSSQVSWKAPIPNSPCGVDAGGVNPGQANPLNWSPCVEQTQADGSVVKTTHASIGKMCTVIVAARVFKDGSAITVSASNYVIYDKEGRLTFMQAPYDGSYPSSTAISPSPWTDAQLAKALSGSDIHGL